MQNVASYQELHCNCIEISIKTKKQKYTIQSLNQKRTRLINRNITFDLKRLKEQDFS